MRSTYVSSLSLIAALVLSFVSGRAHGQSPFPTPTEAQLPLGEGRTELLRSCNLCHPIMPVLGQQRTEPEWRGVVDAMRGRGAVVSDADVLLIAGYLAKHFAPGMPVRPGAGRMPPGRTFILGGRPPDAEPAPGQPLETRDPVGKGQKPAFAGQTRAPAIVTRTPVQAKLVAHGLDHPWATSFACTGVREIGRAHV